MRWGRLRRDLEREPFLVLTFTLLFCILVGFSFLLLSLSVPSRSPLRSPLKDLPQQHRLLFPTANKIAAATTIAPTFDAAAANITNNTATLTIAIIEASSVDIDARSPRLRLWLYLRLCC